MHNVAVRPGSTAERITVRFDATGVDLQRDMRLIAHIGFIGGQRTTPATASILSRLVVSDPQQPPSATTATPNDGTLELLRIETPAPILVSKRTPDGSSHQPLQVIEMPLRLNLPFTQYSDLLSPTPQGLSDMANPGGLSPQAGLNVSVTFMVELQNAALAGPLGATTNREAVGIFGVRLIPGSNSAGTSSPSRPITLIPRQPQAGSGTGAVTSTQPSTGGNLSLEIQEFLTVHNDARAEVGVAPLQWSDDLAQHAQLWADELARRYSGAGQKLEHRRFTRSNAPAPDESPYGENLGWASGDPNWSAADSALGWLAEKSDFLNRTPNKQVGHYTQAVWANTTQVGYGIAKVGGQTWVVGSYNPGGNFVGQLPYPAAPHVSPGIDANGNAAW